MIEPGMSPSKAALTESHQQGGRRVVIPAGSWISSRPMALWRHNRLRAGSDKITGTSVYRFIKHVHVIVGAKPKEKPYKLPDGEGCCQLIAPN
jgi:hypothetical protein